MILTELLIILVLILANGVFSAAEIALIALRKSRLRELVERGNRRARAALALREDSERFLATVQIGVTVVGAAAAAFGGASVAQRLVDPLRRLGLGESAPQVAFLLVVGLVSYLSLVLGELVPKSLALRYSEGYGLFIAGPLRGLARLMRPIVWFLTASSNLVLRAFGDRTTFTEARLSPDELQQLVEEATRTGAVDARTGEIASRAFDLRTLRIDEVMVPRNRIVALRRQATLEEIKRVLLEEGHSRLPVYDGTIDNVVGYIIAKDLLAMTWQKELIVLEDAIRPAYFVPESKRALDVLHELQQRRLQLALVVDEQGGLAGLVTVEDLVEELVGEIFSEYEQPPELIRREPGGSFLVQGLVPIREVNRQLELELPEGAEWSTVGGLCTSLAGEIPQPPARFTLEDGTVVEVVESSPRRVRAVRLHPPPPKPPDSPEV